MPVNIFWGIICCELFIILIALSFCINWVWEAIALWVGTEILFDAICCTVSIGWGIILLLIIGASCFTGYIGCCSRSNKT